MSSFQDLPDDLAIPRSFGIAGEAALSGSPISALLRARQAMQSWLDGRGITEPVEAFGFRQEWQNILIGRRGVSPATERQAARRAIKHAFRSLRSGTSLACADWALPVPVGGLDTFSLLQMEIEALDERVCATDAPDPAELATLLREISFRVAALSDRGLTNEERDILDMGIAIVNLGASNHRGAVYRTPEGALVTLLGRASSGAGHVKRLWAEFRNREAITLTNCFRFEEAYAIFEGLVGHLRADSSSALNDEVLGAALGSAGQAAGLLARTRRDSGLVYDALAYFQAAEVCFTLPGDIERQSTYRLHALCEGALLGDLQLRSLLESSVGPDSAQTRKVQRWLRGADDGPRVDYPLGAWLKAHHTLGRTVQEHPAIVARWLEYSGRAYTKGDQPHPLVMVAGWLAVTSPTRDVPLDLLAPVRSAANSVPTSIVTLIAQTLLFQLVWRENKACAIDFSSLVKVAEGADTWWSDAGLDAWVQGQCGPEGYGPLSAIPFNFV